MCEEFVDYCLSFHYLHCTGVENLDGFLLAVKVKDAKSAEKIEQCII